ncbi:D-methionine transport system substrate-binding protein [Barrientosiimonas humi]|uniref:D-methionine transport system substrate-binding protein n=1 Tax=Barrientosiimonas humi TaxID=999931 RepID=A0A542X8L6_9MICO|nr:MetQ/NlpA family ABC transporter substrate-binding protein [Barrientosiimonas humi]TQL32144.1 D-methionine transport system substrate-binding protein [Barrientosiimonas humi]CAG7572132.1 D-methionine-binding lipoprotein MetQ [Barrientosiimonas humi]
MSSPSSGADATGQIPPLPPYPGSRGRGVRTAITAGGLVVALAAGFGLGRATADDGGSASADEPREVTIGTTEASAEWWPPLQRLARENGIEIKLVSFSDYTQPNPALAQGQTDLNLFQHLQFLASYNSNDNQDLTPIGSTQVVPLPLYSKKHTALNQIPQGGKIAIPNDPTNQARALLVLQQAGLLRLKGGGNALSTPADIDRAASKVTVQPVDAAQTVASLPSVDGAVVNNNFALDGNLDPKSALFQDDPKSKAAEPYINVVVARAEDKDDPTYRKIAQLYHSPEVVAAVKRQSKGTSVVVDRPADQLGSILTRLEKDVAGS